MNIDSISETLRQYLTIRHPELAIHTPLNNGKLAVPYALLSVTAEEELIARNSTWNLALSMEVHSSAYDHPEASNDFIQRANFRIIVQF